MSQIFAGRVRLTFAFAMLMHRQTTNYEGSGFITFGTWVSEGTRDFKYILQSTGGGQTVKSWEQQPLRGHC